MKNEKCTGIVPDDSSNDPQGRGECGKCMEQFSADPQGRGECGKCMEQFSADPYGKDCSYNPIAFPPSMEVRCGECGKCRSSFLPLHHRDKILIINIKKTICHFDQRDSYMNVAIPLVEMTVKSE